MKKSRRNHPAALCCVLLLGVVPAACTPNPEAGDRAEAGATLPLAPAFELPDLDQNTVRLGDFRGQVLLLDLWATWCAPCLAEIPTYNTLFETYRDEGFRVVGVAVQSGWAGDIRPAAAEHDIRYPVLVGNDDIVQEYGMIAFPTSFLIDRDGAIRKKYVGTVPDKAKLLEEDIRTLLAERS